MGGGPGFKLKPRRLESLPRIRIRRQTREPVQPGIDRVQSLPRVQTRVNGAKGLNLLARQCQKTAGGRDSGLGRRVLSQKDKGARELDQGLVEPGRRRCPLLKPKRLKGVVSFKITPRVEVDQEGG